MRSPTLLIPCCLSLGLATLVACGGDEAEAPVATPDEEGVAQVVPDGKADNYLSTNGREYFISGTDRFELPRLDDEDDETYQARAAEHAELRFRALTYFLNAYVTGKTSHDDNFGYGGFRTTVRQRSIRADDLWVGEAGEVSVKFTTEVGGPNRLMADLGAKAVGDNLWRFDLVVPKLTTSEIEQGTFAKTYRGFNGDDLAEDKRAVMELDLSVEESSADAFPRYAEMMQDGVFDIAVLVGGDYNEKRWDLVNAEDIYKHLVNDLGFASPVADFGALALDSGPFTKSIDTPKGKVAVQVFMVHPGQSADDPQALIEATKAHAKARDVVIYDGHAGYDANYSGIVVTYHPRTAISANDFAELDLPSKQQLFVFNGCKTYTVYPDALYANPAKSPENLDIISTVNFSWLSEMTRVTGDLIGSMTRVGRFDGLHEPSSYSRLLSDLNRGRSWDVIYGVHGLDDNPHASPWAEPARLCAACSHHADCGGAGSLCVSGACGYACTADDACPGDFNCREVAYSGVIETRQCVPERASCR